MVNPQITIISTGSELTAGRSIDTNSAWIARELFEMGWIVRNFIILPDDPACILEELQRLKSRVILNSEIPILVIMTGGLGSTEDDYTLQCALSLQGKKSEVFEKARIKLQMFYESRGAAYTNILPEVLRQAHAPENTKVMENSVGLAVGFIEEIGKNSYLACMPGVPIEMKEMYKRRLLPFIKRCYEKADLFQETRWVWNLGESLFQDEFMKKQTDLTLQGLDWGVTAQKGFIKAIFQSRKKDLVTEAVKRITEYYKEICTGDVFEQVHEHFVKNNQTLSVAESCTGGLLGKKITDAPGSSQYFLGGVLAYSNTQKANLLKIDSKLLATHGAVSKEACICMVEGLESLIDSDYSIAITGIAGPSGGSEAKPVGTVWIGRKKKGRAAEAILYRFPGNRETVRENAANTAFFLLQQIF